MAAGVFMAVDLRHRKRLAPKLRNVFESLWMNFREHPRVDPDIGNAYATAMNAARQQQMRLLSPEERDGLRGADRDAPDRPGGSVNAPRHATTQNRRPVG